MSEGGDPDALRAAQSPAQRSAQRSLARTRGARTGRAAAALTRALTFERLQWISFAHSIVYTALLVCAFALGGPQPFTFILGLTHGLAWIGMSIACIVAARLRVVPLRLAVAVAVLGGIGPFFGSAEFVRERRRRARARGRRPPAASALS